MKILYNIQKKFSSFDQVKSCVYPIDSTLLEYVNSNLLPGNSTVLYSGSYRLNLDATYIEPKIFSLISDIPWKINTLFIDSSIEKIVKYTIQKLKTTNLLILHSAFFLQYRHWTKINNDILDLRKLCKRLIVSMPLNRIDFNRLKYSNHDMATMMQGTIIQDTLLVCR